MSKKEKEVIEKLKARLKENDGQMSTGMFAQIVGSGEYSSAFWLSLASLGQYDERLGFGIDRMHDVCHWQ